METGRDGNGAIRFRTAFSEFGFQNFVSRMEFSRTPKTWSSAFPAVLGTSFIMEGPGGGGRQHDLVLSVFGSLGFIFLSQLPRRLGILHKKVKDILLYSRISSE